MAAPAAKSSSTMAATTDTDMTSSTKAKGHHADKTRKPIGASATTPPPAK